jgi:hypothetical protein
MLAQRRERAPPRITGGGLFGAPWPVEVVAGPGIGDEFDVRAVPPGGFRHRAHRIDPDRRHGVRLTHQRDCWHRPEPDDIRLIGQNGYRIVSDPDGDEVGMELA